MSVMLATAPTNPKKKMIDYSTDKQQQQWRLLFLFLPAYCPAGAG
jgi:hypothetical protein